MSGKQHETTAEVAPAEGQPTRNERWQAIYNRKGRLGIEDQDLPAHVLGGYDMFTEEQWVAQLRLLLDPPADDHKRRVSLREVLVRGKGESGNQIPRVLEVGVGGGAFIDGMKKVFSSIPIEASGVDYCPNLIECVSKRVEGKFAVADARNLAEVSWLQDPNQYDVVCSFGVTQYLNTLEDAGKKLAEMARVTKKGGAVLVAEVSDSAREHVAMEMRAKSHASLKKVSNDSPGHLYISKKWWADRAEELGLSVNIYDHTDIGLKYATAPYRYSVFMEKK